MIENFKKIQNSELFSVDLMNLEPRQLVLLRVLLAEIQNKVKAKLETVNAGLRLVVDNLGKEDEKGHKVLNLDTGVATLQKRVSSVPDLDLLKKVLADSDIDNSEVFDRITRLEFNATKLAALIDCGDLEKKEVDNIKNVEFALVVKKNEDFFKESV